MIALIAVCLPALAGGPAVPFGSHRHRLPAGMIVPGQDRAAMDQAVASFYEGWKKHYLTPGCSPGQLYVKYKKNGHTVSEAHGYGMLITALMAGVDPAAQKDFDALYAFFRAHPSEQSKDLMAWKQDRACRDIEGPSTASDGDLDIAYSLILADRQWGSCGKVNYMAEARKVVAAIKKHETDTSHRYVTLGSWAIPGNKRYDATRGSDLMPGHYRAFLWITQDKTWKGLIDETYKLVNAIQQNHARATGMIPDFIQSPLKNPRPARPRFLEAKSDGEVGYNACRVPLRMAADFAVSGDPRAKQAVSKMANWMSGSPIGGKARNVMAGYTLSGRATAKFTDLAFTGPFGCAAVVDPSYQAMLDNFWGTIVRTRGEGYYGDSLKLLSMILMSGNWWAPWMMPEPCRRGG